MTINEMLRFLMCFGIGWLKLGQNLFLNIAYPIIITRQPKYFTFFMTEVPII